MNFVTQRLPIILLLNLLYLLIRKYAELVLSKVILESGQHVLSEKSCLIHKGHGIYLNCNQLRL